MSFGAGGQLIFRQLSGNADLARTHGSDVERIQDLTIVQKSRASPGGESRQTVSAIETGKFDPSLPLAFRAARLFALRIEEIFQDEDRRSLGPEIEKDKYV